MLHGENHHVTRNPERAPAHSRLQRRGPARRSTVPSSEWRVGRHSDLQGTNERVSARRGLVEFVLVATGAVGATVVLTAPLAFEADHVGRIDNFDGQFSIWNVAWVARTIVVNPWGVFDANIFYPARNTLAF